MNPMTKILSSQGNISSSNLTNLLIIRERYGGVNKKALYKAMLYSKQREMLKACEQKYNKRQLYYDGVLYVDNFKYYYDETRVRSDAKCLRRTGFELHKRCFDILRTPPSIGGESVYLLTEGELIECAVKRGKWTFSQRVYLGHRFLHICWSRPFERFVLTYRQRQRHGVSFLFAIFDVAPLRLVGVLEIQDIVFGRVTDASVSGDILFLQKGKQVEMHDLNEIIEQNLTRAVNFGDAFEGGIVGESPTRLPVNIAPRKAPLVLKAIENERLNQLSFGDFPWSYLSSDEFGAVTVRSLACPEYKIVAQASSMLDVPVHFHDENSGRIVFVDGDTIRIYKSNLNQGRFDTIHTITLNESIHQLDNSTTAEDIVSRYGRVIKPTVTESLQCESVHSIDYCVESDTLAIVYTKRYLRSEPRYCVALFDNATFQKTREILVKGETVSEQVAWVVYLNELSIICVQKHFSACKKFFIFELQHTTRM